MAENKNFLRAFVSRAEDGDNGQPGDPIRFTASTAGIKRDGLDLDMQDWLLDNYRKNPVFLWAHDYWGKYLPLGRVKAEVEGDRLMAEVVFDQNDDFARAVERKYRDGFLHTVSVGWNFVEVDKKRKMELLDISGVPVPGDPDALMERQYQVLKRIFEVDSGQSTPAEAGQAVDRIQNSGLSFEDLGKEKFEDDAATRGEQEPVWEKVAAEMVGIFLSPGDESDELRERRYRALLPKYRRLGKVAPEFLTAEELSALDEKEIAGLFLEGEVEGERLKAKGESVEDLGLSFEEVKEKLDSAMSLIRSVYEKLESGAKVTQKVENEDGEKDQALMMRAMELNLKMRSLK